MRLHGADIGSFLSLHGVGWCLVQWIAARSGGNKTEETDVWKAMPVALRES